jgi:DNA-binding response OmpR family regulator
MPTLLLLEDEQSVRQSLAMYMEDYGFDILQAETVKSALELLAEHSVDLAVVDIRLPDTTGDVFIVEAKKIKPDLQFIIYTGSINYEVKNGLIELGVDPYSVFYKPTETLDVIASRIKYLLSEE